MFTSWFDLGLRAENIHVLGKCYSTNEKVRLEMGLKGIQVSPHSSLFYSHRAYDDLFDKLVRDFLKSKLDALRSFEKVILLDDGGHLLKAAMELSTEEKRRIIGIEQTSSGYEKLRNCRLDFPVINVAKCEAKEKYEPDWVAQSIVGKTFEKLSKEPEHILIIGRGVIGRSIFSILSGKYQVEFWDIKDSSLPIDPFLERADLVFGCTGNVSIPHSKHSLIKQGCVLASGSSSDREFDGVHFRKRFAASNNCHADFNDGRFTLLNGGFPVNFTGRVHSILPERIQLIRALKTIGVLQAATLGQRENGLIDLDRAHQDALIKKWEEGQIPFPLQETNPYPCRIS